MVPAPTLRSVDPADLLLLATAGGDTDAFAQLYADLRPRVHGLATRILRDTDYAAEVTQEVFVEVWGRAGRFDPARGSALAWIMAMTHHRAVDRVRAESAARRRDTAYGHRNLGVAYDETFASGTARIESSAVRAACSTLSPRQRQAIELNYFGGLTHSEVARRLGIPLGTAKSRIRDGLARLRDALGELAPEAA